jgi:hypothetical protein
MPLALSSLTLRLECSHGKNLFSVSCGPGGDCASMFGAGLKTPSECLTEGLLRYA